MRSVCLTRVRQRRYVHAAVHRRRTGACGIAACACEGRGLASWNMWTACGGHGDSTHAHRHAWQRAVLTYARSCVAVLQVPCRMAGLRCTATRAVGARAFETVLLSAPHALVVHTQLQGVPLGCCHPARCGCTCAHARAFGSVCSARWLTAAAEQAAQSAFESPRSESMLLQHLLRDGHAALRCVRLHGRHTRCALRTAKVRVMVSGRSAAAAQSHGMHCAVCAWHDTGGSRAHGTCALAIRQSADRLLRHGRGH